MQSLIMLRGTGRRRISRRPLPRRSIKSIRTAIHGFEAIRMFKMRQFRVSVDAGGGKAEGAERFLSLCFSEGKA